MMSIFLNGNFYLSRILQLAKMQKVEPKRGEMGWVGGWNIFESQGLKRRQWRGNGEKSKKDRKKNNKSLPSLTEGAEKIKSGKIQSFF